MRALLMAHSNHIESGDDMHFYHFPPHLTQIFDYFQRQQPRQT